MSASSPTLEALRLLFEGAASSWTSSNRGKTYPIKFIAYKGNTSKQYSI